ncbi:hypothetical protein Tco_1371232 [Tanacetum coccineum]
MYTFSPMMVANSRKHHCRVRSYTREVLVISTNLDIQKNHYPLDFRNRRGDEARIKNTWYNQGLVNELCCMGGIVDTTEFNIGGGLSTLRGGMECLGQSQNRMRSLLYVSRRRWTHAIPADVSLSMSVLRISTLGRICIINRRRVTGRECERGARGGGGGEHSVMSSALSAVTYTSVYTDSEPGRPVAPPSPDYVPGPEHPPSPDYVPGPEHPPSLVEVPYVPEPEYPEYLVPSDVEAPLEDQPLPADSLPTALSPGYVADSDPNEDWEKDHADYPADGGDGDDDPSNNDDDDVDDKDEEPFEDENDDEEEERLAPADSFAIPVFDPIPSAGDTEAFETDEAAPTPVPSPRRHTARMSVRPQTPIPLPSEAEVERLLALPIPPPSPLSPWSSPLPQIPSPPLPPPPSSLHLPPHVPTSLPLPSSPLPPLPASLFIPPPVDRREDIPEAELPPHKRLCPTAPTSRYEVGESSTAAPRPTGGHRADYGFIGTMDAEIRRQRAEEVGYGIRDVWVDPTEAVEEVAPTTLEGVNARVTELAAVQEQDTQDVYAVIEDAQDRQTQLSQRVDVLVEDRQFHYETARLLDQEALVSREAWAHSVGLSSAVHYELQAYRTHTQMQDYRIASQESLMTTLIAQVSSLQGQLSAALGQIQALQARDQTHADDREGAGSSA